MTKTYHLSLKIITLSMLGLVVCGCDFSSKPSSSLSNLESEALPEPLTIAEALPSSGDSVCASGGIRLVYGLDHDKNGSVGPYESIGMEYLCNPSSNTDKGQRVVVIGNGVPAADKARLLAPTGS